MRSPTKIRTKLALPTRRNYFGRQVGVFGLFGCFWVGAPLVVLSTMQIGRTGLGAFATSIGLPMLLFLALYAAACVAMIRVWRQELFRIRRNEDGLAVWTNSGVALPVGQISAYHWGTRVFVRVTFPREAAQKELFLVAAGSARKSAVQELIGRIG